MEEEIKKEIIGKSGFPLYVDYWEKYFSQMSGEQVKECLKIIFHFNINFEVLGSDDLAVKMVAITIIDNLKRDAQKRIKQSKASRDNGLLGGRPKKDDKPEKPKKTQDKPKKPNGLSENKENLELQFEEFWKLYRPIHTGRGNKENSKELFFKAIKKDTLDNIAKGLDGYMKHCWSKNTYTKSVEAWLRNEGWKDDYNGIAEPARGKVAELRDVFKQFLDQDND